MKLKHWQGYGFLNAKKISHGKTGLIVKVYGNHDYGLDRSDFPEDVFNWLVRRFDKNVSYGDIRSVEFHYCDDEIVNGVKTECGVYTILYKCDMFPY